MINRKISTLDKDQLATLDKSLDLCRLNTDLYLKNNPSRFNQTSSSSHFVHISVE